jgi:signal transduction histidine kinase
VKLRHLRFIVPILLLHMVAVPGLVHIFFGYYEQAYMRIEQEAVRDFLIRVQDEIGRHQMAAPGNAQHIQVLLDSLYSGRTYRSLSVFNMEGRRIAFKGEPGLESKELLQATRIDHSHGGDLMTVTHWVRNAPECHACHDPAQTTIAVLEGVLPVAGRVRIFGLSRLQVLAASTAVAVLVFVAVMFGINRFVTRPVRQVMEAMHAVRNGDLDVQVPVQRPDELGDMAENFNQVVAALRKARSEVEARHEAGMARAEQLAVMGEIASGLAHEVKNPIAGISSALEVVLTEIPAGDPHREILVQIGEETRRISGIITRLLDYARPRELRPDWIDLGLLLGDIKAIYNPQCQKHRVEFDLRVPMEPGRMYADPGVLRQVMFNVLQNALHAAGEGGRVALAVETQAEAVAFRVADSGPGIPPEVRARLFQPFFTTKAGGTGLGLAIVHRLVTAMGGTVEVESGEGRGTCFTIRLPRETLNETVDR